MPMMRTEALIKLLSEQEPGSLIDTEDLRELLDRYQKSEDAARARAPEPTPRSGAAGDTGEKPPPRSRRGVFKSKTGEVKCKDDFDRDGNAAGGYVRGVGLDIQWQDGPSGPERHYTGSVIEDPLKGVRFRLTTYQLTKYACDANALAIHHIDQALIALSGRDIDREARGVMGTADLDAAPLSGANAGGK